MIIFQANGASLEIEVEPGKILIRNAKLIEEGLFQHENEFPVLRLLLVIIGVGLFEERKQVESLVVLNYLLSRVFEFHRFHYII